ncbi:hypothetical protein NW762_001424 [Fusarium torreyae]|uniref:Uncharacterized protein n=1 Tax=Fusarium torreyae TaxID=1237075 RepID=A0A9W8SE21_9HYPO|nr:hypothetical protein NW762_001424 [Fusarium torreyae]
MNDIFDDANTIRQRCEALLAATNQIRSPANIARQERLEYLQRSIEYELKFTRADTLGNVNAGPITQLILEKARLEDEIERDKNDYTQKLQDAHDLLASSFQSIRSRSALSRSTSGPSHGHTHAGSIPTPSRSSLSRQSNPQSPHFEIQPPGSSLNLRGQSGHEADHQGDPERDTNSHQPLLMGSEDYSSNTAQGRHSTRRTASTVPSIENRPAKRSRQNEERREVVEVNDVNNNARRSVADDNPANPGRDSWPTAAASAQRTNRKKTRGRKPKPKPQQWIAPTSYTDLDPRIRDLKPGDIAAVRWGRAIQFTPVMILPWGRFKRFKIDKTLDHTGLNGSIPNCYEGARHDDVHPRPWAAGFEDNGRSAHRRSLPAWFFGVEEDFPWLCESGWVKLNQLKVYDENCPLTINKEAVAEYIDCHAEHHRELEATAAAERAAENEPAEHEDLDRDLPEDDEQGQSHDSRRIMWASSSEPEDTSNRQSGCQQGQNGAVTERNRDQAVKSEDERVIDTGSTRAAITGPISCRSTNSDWSRFQGSFAGPSSHRFRS